jgi:DNA-binding transcriptional LysR family regulator
MKPNRTILGHVLDGVEAFILVADRRNFRAVARELHISPSALSQKIRSLEERIGVALLTRTTRNVGLTQAGQIFLERARPALANLGDAYDMTRNLGQPAGLLRLQMPRGVIPFLIEPILAGFCEAYPQIDIEVIADDGMPKLVEDGLDAGVQLAEQLDADMIALRLTSPIRFVVVGSPAYFDRHDRPKRPADVRHHQCVRVHIDKYRVSQWVFMEDGAAHDVTVGGRVITNDPSLALSAARQGLGLHYSAEGSVLASLASGELETVLREFMPQSRGVFLYYPNRHQALPKLRAFTEYVQSHLARSGSGLPIFS